LLFEQSVGDVSHDSDAVLPHSQTAISDLNTTLTPELLNKKS
jgi:hypothetical protein